MQRGNSIVEVVVGAAILSMVALAFLGTISTLARFHQKDMYAIKGALLAEEGIEAVRFIKGTGWTNISSLPTGQTRYLSASPTTWTITTSPEVIDGVFYRSFRVSQVRRDATDDIVASGGTIDSGTLLVDVTVSWRASNATTSTTYKAYMTNI